MDRHVFYVTVQFDSRWFTRWLLSLLGAAISVFTLTPSVSKLIFTWLLFPDHLSGTGRNHRHPFHRQHSSKAQIISSFAPCARSCVRSRTATNLKRNQNENSIFIQPPQIRMSTFMTWMPCNFLNSNWQGNSSSIVVTRLSRRCVVLSEKCVTTHNSLWSTRRHRQSSGIEEVSAGCPEKSKSIFSE